MVKAGEVLSWMWGEEGDSFVPPKKVDGLVVDGFGDLQRIEGLG